jgi:diguanylate cyclase (GGDEF)-like protein
MNILEQKDPEWAKSMKDSGVFNVVLYPLRVNKKIVGYIWATNFNSDKIGTIKQVMELNSFLLAAEIANHQLFEKMDRMSRYDMLTGVFNRNAMNNRIIESKDGTKPIENDYGIVFVDVNGLKHINDLEGHLAGDQMIKSVADCLKNRFPGSEIYRAGGDEFMVIAEGYTRDEFNALIAKLRNINEKEDSVHFAVGSFFDEIEHNIQYAIQAADASMYADKSAYHKNHPELSRRSE